MRLYIISLLAVILLTISIVFIILTFTLENWIIVKIDFNRYGMWRGCIGLTYNCYNWYENGENLLNYSLTDNFKAFQGLQCCMAGLTFLTLVSFVINLKICDRMFLIFIIDGLLILVSACSGLTSVIIFGTTVYYPSIHQLDWCYWLSLSACILEFFSFFLIMGVAFKTSDKYESDAFRQRLSAESASDFSNNNSNNNINNNKKNPQVNKIDEQNGPNLQKQTASSSPKYLRRSDLPPAKTHSDDLKNVISNSPKYLRRSDLMPPKSNSDDSKQTKTVTSRSDINKTGSSKKRNGKYRYKHKHFTDYFDTIQKEQFQPGYTSEPENIEYSLDRSWLNNSTTDLNQSLPSHLDDLNNLDTSFSSYSKNFVKLPKLIFYDGFDHYSRPSKKNYK